MRYSNFIRLMEATALDPVPTSVGNVLQNVLERSVVKSNVIENVHLLGYNSANGYTYGKEAVKASVEHYNNVPVYLNHSEKSRNVEDKFAFIANPRFEEGTGIWGDVVANEAHQYYATFKWWAENAPSQIGMSHDAFCVFDPETNEITEISKVQSVDLVSRPATVAGLFESFKEGIIDDKVTDDKLLKRFNEIVDKAIELIEQERWAFDPKPVSERADAIKYIADDLSRMMGAMSVSNPKLNNNNLSQEEEDMKWEDIDFKALEENRPDLVTKIRDDHATVIAQQQKKIEEALKDVPEDLRSELFVEQVTAAVTAGNETLVTKLVEDRKALVSKPTSTGITTQTNESESDQKPKGDSKEKILEELAL